jgi:hypothetical protein
MDEVKSHLDDNDDEGGEEKQTSAHGCEAQEYQFHHGRDDEHDPVSRNRASGGAHQPQGTNGTTPANVHANNSSSVNGEPSNSSGHLTHTMDAMDLEPNFPNYPGVQEG